MAQWEKEWIVVSHWESGVTVRSDKGLPDDWRAHMDTLKVAKRGYCK